MVICLEQGANDLHMVCLMPLPPHHLLLQYRVSNRSAGIISFRFPGDLRRHFDEN